MRLHFFSDFINQVGSSNLELQSRVGRAYIVMDHTKINDGREKHRAHKGDVDAGAFQGAWSQARINIIGLAPDVCLAAKVLPAMVVQQVLQVTKVTNFGINVPHYGSGAFGLGINFLANGIDE